MLTIHGRLEVLSCDPDDRTIEMVWTERERLGSRNRIIQIVIETTDAVFRIREISKHDGDRVLMMGPIDRLPEARDLCSALYTAGRESVYVDE